MFEPYTWHKGPESFVDFQGHLIPSRIPLSALIDGMSLEITCPKNFTLRKDPFSATGPMAGATSFLPGDNHPRAVSIEYFDKICPYERRTFVEIKDVNEGLEGRTVEEVLQKYVHVLSAMNETCVELRGGIEHPFDWP